MRQIVYDWMNFCEGKREFEDGYFFTLFMENLTIEEINVIYSYFPNADMLTARMEKFLFGPKAIELPPYDRVCELDRLIRLDFVDREFSLKSLSPSSNGWHNLIFNYVEDDKIVDNLILDDIYTQSFHDFMRSKKITSEKKMYLLFDALYGITYDFDFQLYLYAPLLATSYTGEHLFQFKRLGGVYAVTNEEIVYSFKVM